MNSRSPTAGVVPARSTSCLSEQDPTCLHSHCVSQRRLQLREAGPWPFGRSQAGARRSEEVGRRGESGEADPRGQGGQGRSGPTRQGRHPSDQGDTGPTRQGERGRDVRGRHAVRQRGERAEGGDRRRRVRDRHQAADRVRTLSPLRGQSLDHPPSPRPAGAGRGGQAPARARAPPSSRSKPAFGTRCPSFPRPTSSGSPPRRSSSSPSSARPVSSVDSRRLRLGASGDWRVWRGLRQSTAGGPPLGQASVYVAAPFAAR